MKLQAPYTAAAIAGKKAAYTADLEGRLFLHLCEIKNVSRRPSMHRSPSARTFFISRRSSRSSVGAFQPPHLPPSSSEKYEEFLKLKKKCLFIISTFSHIKVNKREKLLIAKKAANNNRLNSKVKEVKIT